MKINIKMLRENVKAYEKEQERLRRIKEQEEYEKAKKKIEEEMVKIEEEIIKSSKEGKTSYSFIVTVKQTEYNPMHIWEQAFYDLGLDVKIKLNAYNNFATLCSSDYLNPLANYLMGNTIQYKVIVKW